MKAICPREKPRKRKKGAYSEEEFSQEKQFLRYSMAHHDHPETALAPQLPCHLRDTPETPVPERLKATVYPDSRKTI
jgi:hypothetical protein